MSVLAYEAGAFDNAGEENLANTRAIQNDPEVLRNTQVALMGDMNHGPQMDGQSHFQPSYDAVVNGTQSYCSPYVTQVGACTFCKTNPILALLGTMYSFILDHVYLKAPFLMCSGGNLTSNRHNVTSSVSCDGPPLPVCNFEQLLPALNSSAELSYQLIYSLNAGSVMLVVM